MQKDDFSLLRDKDALDFIASEVLKKLELSKYLPHREELWLHSYHSLKEIVHSRFCIPQTSISPLMSRLLFGISAYCRPKVIVGIGTYVGYTLAWISGPAISPKKLYETELILGVDPDPSAFEIAKSNFRNIDARQVQLQCMDGHKIFENFNRFIDMIYLDADDLVLRKKVYASLLKVAYPHLKPSAIVLAHDVCYPKFLLDFLEYNKMVTDTSLFSKAANIAIDEYGLGIAIKAE